MGDLLKGRVAIVTGAGGGLGEQHALALAEEGAKVVVNDLGGVRDGSGAGSEMADGVVEKIKAAGGEAVANYDSVATMQGAENIMKTALDAFDQVDILVNNAGILRDRAFHNMSEEEWDMVNTVHLRGTFCVTRVVFPYMRQRGSGVIINTSSTSGLNGNFGQANYGAAKGGIWGFGNVLAIEGYRRGQPDPVIKVFTLAPVAFTRMTSDLAPFQAEESQARMDPKLVSPMVVFLASDLSKGLSGKTFNVGGGRIAEMKMVTAPGATKADGLWTPQEIADRIKEILVPEA
jgi:NAD(P)-dependent dehydrogenase (short-subunit alcohol dehydrogenase family)